MAIKDFLMGSIREFTNGNPAVSMACICIAMDATAKIEFGGSTRKRCIQYIEKYLDIIIMIGLGGVLLVGPGSRIHLLDPLHPKQTANIAHTIYGAIRCSLIHEANLPFKVEFTKKSFFGIENSIFLIPINMVVALMAAVIVSPTNSNIKLDDSFSLILKNERFPINQLVGNASKLRVILGLKESSL